MKKGVAISIISILTVLAIALCILFVSSSKTIDTLNASISEKEKQIETISADAADKADQIEALNADVADKANQIDTLNADVAEKADQISTLTADATDKAEQIKALNADVVDKASKIEALSADVESQAEQISELKAGAIEKASQIDLLNANISEKTSQIETLNADITDKATKIEKLNEIISENSNQIEKLSSDIADKDKQIANLNADITGKFAQLDLNTASYEDMAASYVRLKNYMIERLKEQFVSTREIESAEGITFKDIPWGSTKKEVESIIGKGNKTSSYVSVKRGTVNTDGIGKQITYENWTLTGYPVFWTEVNYVYPVIDGIMLRDDDLAVLYLVEYDLFDIGDENAVVEDLTSKLTKLYGSYSTGNRNTRTWVDKNNNSIELSSSKTRVYLVYSSAQKDILLGNAQQIVEAERKEQEEILRIQNQDNTDGL